MKTPISYYGGKQKLAKIIVSQILPHKSVIDLYGEPFFGGGAVFFELPKFPVEVINDTNRELINFYKVVQHDFVSLQKLINITLHSRSEHADAQAVYARPHMFNDVKRAWAVWVLAAMSFSSKLDGPFGYDISKNTTSKKIKNKREGFTEEFAIRLQDVQIECTDAVRIITSRDTKRSFFYCDPPYFNSDMGHYDGYTKEDFKGLLNTLQNIEGKFLLSSYPSPVLKEAVKANGWHQLEFKSQVSVNKGAGKEKTEVLTANYALKA